MEWKTQKITSNGQSVLLASWWDAQRRPQCHLWISWIELAAGLDPRNFRCGERPQRSREPFQGSDPGQDAFLGATLGRGLKSQGRHHGDCGDTRM